MTFILSFWYCFLYRNIQRFIKACVVERLLIQALPHLSTYNITTANWVVLKSGKKFPDVFFARLAAVNVYYGAFGKLFEGLPSSVNIFDKISHQVIETHYRQYSQLVEGFYSLFSACNDINVDGEDAIGKESNLSLYARKGEGKDNDRKKEDDEGEEDIEGVDEGADDNYIPSEADPNVKFVLSKIVVLKLISGHVINLLVNITSGLGISTFDIVDKVGIVAANLLADVIANPFGIVFPINFFTSLDTFIAFAGSFIEGASIANSVKSFTNVSVTLVSFTVKANTFSNLSADILPVIKLFT